MSGRPRKPGVPRQPGVAAEPWDTSGFKRVSKSDRMKMMLSKTINRFWRKREDNRLQSKVGPGCCPRCGSEPCGGGWGVLFGNESARCCAECNHEPVPRWKPTHIIWYGKKAFIVKEVPIGRAGCLYQRQDGVSWFCRIGAEHYFLGVELAPSEFARFKVGDPHGWPDGVKGSDMGVGLGDEAGELDEDEVDEEEVDEDDDALGEDDPEDDEDSDGIEEEDEDDDDAEDDEDAEADDEEVEYDEDPDDGEEDGDDE